MPQVMTQFAIEDDGMRLSAKLEAQTATLAKAAREAAIARGGFKIAFAQAVTRVQAPNAQEREALAYLDCEEAFRLNESCQAEFLIAQEGCRTIRAQLDWLRSVNANVRHQVTG